MLQQNVPGLDNRNFATINGFEAALRPIIIDRGASSLAVTGSIEPEFHSHDLLYEPETTRADLGVWEKESSWGVSAALAYQIVPKVVIGADLWYLQHYDGLALNTFTCDAVSWPNALLADRAQDVGKRRL
jgi:hypothetical protein